MLHFSVSVGLCVEAGATQLELIYIYIYVVPVVCFPAPELNVQ